MRHWLILTGLLLVVAITGFVRLAPEFASEKLLPKDFNSWSVKFDKVGRHAERGAEITIAAVGRISSRAVKGYQKVKKALGPQKEDLPLRQYAYQGVQQDGANRARLASPYRDGRHLKSTTEMPTDIRATGK